MLTLSRPVGFLVAVSVVGIGIYAYTGAQGDSGNSSVPPATTAKPSEKPSEFTREDFGSHFDSPAPKSPLRNIFMPVVKNDASVSPDAGAGGKDILRIPANLASGNPNWIFTGYAVINGVKSGLLEDHTTHHSEFVKEGESWKTCRVVRINSGSIVLNDLAGSEVAVMRFDPLLAAKSDTKTGPDLGLKPLDPGPALQGPIGNEQPGGPGGPGGSGGRRIRRGGPMAVGSVQMDGPTVSVGG